MKTLSELLNNIRPDTMLGMMPDSVFNAARARGYDWGYTHYTWYHALARHFCPGHIFEIGVLEGLSLAAMLLGCYESKAIGWDIEGYVAGSNKDAARNLARCGVADRAFIDHVDSQKKDILPYADMIHIDGDHSFTGATHDLEMAFAARIPVILFDDMFNRSTQCAEAGEGFLRRHAASIVDSEILPTATGLLVIQCKHPA